MSSSAFEKMFKGIVMSNVGSLGSDPEISISSGTQLTFDTFERCGCWSSLSKCCRSFPPRFEVPRVLHKAMLSLLLMEYLHIVPAPDYSLYSTVGPNGAFLSFFHQVLTVRE